MRRRSWGCGVGGALVVGFALWFGLNDRLNLRNRATPITSVRGWGLDEPAMDVPISFHKLLSDSAQYEWVGDRQILFFHDLQSPYAIRQMNYPGAASGSYVILTYGNSRRIPPSIGRPTLYDLATHREQALPELTEMFRRSGGISVASIVSSDGTRLFWHDKSQLHIALLDGSQHAVIASSGVHGIAWSQDSAQAITYGWARDKRARAQIPPNTHGIAVDLWDRNDGKPLGQRVFSPPADYHQVGECALMPDGNLAANSLNSNLVLGKPAPLVLYNITPAPNSVVHSATPALPSGATVKELIYSPQGDRLAWVIDRVWPAPLAFLHRWFPKFVPASLHSTSLWVSGTLGENLHEIGHLPVQTNGRAFLLLDYVRWKPDEKTLSFVSNEVLYTVPAD